MKIISKNCLDCGKEIEKVPNARYARKYCKECSEKRKKDWDNIHLINIEDCED